MPVIEGFWAGAARVGHDVDLPLLAQRAGGWAELERASAARLQQLGVSGELAERWLRAHPVRTRWTPVRVCDAEYPPQLLRLCSPGVSERGCAPPPVLFVDGDPEVLHRPSIAIVGTRSCTPYGVGLARQAARIAVGAGRVVVSGLARGIDGHAHRAACEVGTTVAVVAHGLQHTSPASHRRLRRDLVDRGGAVLSTWPDEVPATPYRFPKRNRWIAALADQVLVVEAPVRSGALLTAEFAVRIGRPVLVFPGRLGSESSAGCFALAERGEATLLPSLDALARRLGGGAALESHDGWLRRVFGGTDLIEVARERGVSYVELLADLTRLEVEGRVVRLPGRRYAPAGGQR